MEQIRFEKCKDGSYVHNCFLVRRESDSSEHMFHQDGNGNSISAFLNGYAIIPVEVYGKLINEKLVDASEIEEADRQLRI